MTQKTTKIPRLPLTDDYIFKRVFAFEGNESVLKDLLEAILRKDIKTVTIKNPEIIPYEKDDKRGLLDIKAETDDGTVLDIEMQMEDKKNAEEYQIQFKHYYYPRMETRTFAIDATDNNTYKQDIFFIGEDKGRLNELLKWKEIFEKMGRCTCKFLILKTKHKFYFKHRNELISKPIPYDEVIKEIKQSRAILDFAQSRQHGLTYRPMEAMCFQKKLITNFEEITDYNFYNPKNIFRLSHDNINDLKSFLEQPYEPVDDSIREEYVAANWLDSFFQ